MANRTFFQFFFCSILLCSCYLKQYEAVKLEKGILQNKFDSVNTTNANEKTMLQKRYDSINVENSKKVALNLVLKSENDSIVQNNVEFQKQLIDFRRNIPLHTGAKFTPAAVINKSPLFKSSGLATKTNIPNILYNPAELSSWGNFAFGDCVTAEEAFAKACNNPEIFIPYEVAVGWATENGVRDKASIVDVLSKMTEVGFRMNETTNNDGHFSRVDFKNSSILQDAIATGPVKIGLTSTQLESAYRNSTTPRGWFALNFKPEPVTVTNQHCVSLCGYGTLSWLAQQFHVPLPFGANGQNVGYAFFTWGTIGIIDQQSLFTISNEAWVRNPTSVTNNSVSSFILKAMGGEANRNIYLSHAYGNLELRRTYPGGFGEIWICHELGGGKINLQTRGKEADFILYLSHANGNLSLRGNREGGEEWIIHNLPNGQIALEASGSEKGRFLSHAFGNLELRTNLEGGEAWLNIGQH